MNAGSTSGYSSDKGTELRRESDSELSCEDQDTEEEESISNVAKDDGTLGLTVHSWNIETDLVVTSSDEEELADLIGVLSKYLCTKEFVDSRSNSTIIVSTAEYWALHRQGSPMRERDTSRLSSLR